VRVRGLDQQYRFNQMESLFGRKLLRSKRLRVSRRAAQLLQRYLSDIRHRESFANAEKSATDSHRRNLIRYNSGNDPRLYRVKTKWHPKPPPDTILGFTWRESANSSLGNWFNPPFSSRLRSLLAQKQASRTSKTVLAVTANNSYVATREENWRIITGWRVTELQSERYAFAPNAAPCKCMHAIAVARGMWRQ